MSLRALGMASGCLAGLLLIAGCSRSGGDAGPGERPAVAAGDHVIVKFKEGRSAGKVLDEMERRGYRAVFRSEFANFTRVGVPADSSPEATVEALERLPDVEYAEPDWVAKTAYVPDDPLWPDQWNLRLIGVDLAWNVVPGGAPSVVVAVVDTGVAYEEYGIYRKAPDFAGTTFVNGYDFVEGDPHPNDENGHGTHICGTVAETANNALGLAGIAFRTSIMPVKVLGKDGTGYYSTVAEGIYWAVDHGAKVINLSLTGLEPSNTLRNALAYAVARNVVVVAAAGNTGGAVEYPAAYNDLCISVGAVASDRSVTPYSCGGGALDFVAPGGAGTEGVRQQTLLNRDPSTFAYVSMNGTSMAAAHVTGTVALLKALGLENLDQVEAVLRATVEDRGPAGWDSDYGYGLIQAGAAVYTVAGVPLPPPPPPPPPPPQLLEIILDDGDPGTSAGGFWGLSSVPGGYDGGSLYCWGGAANWYRWTPTLSGTGEYDVYLWWTASAGRASAVPVRVVHAGLQWTATVDQTKNGGKWVLLGRWPFEAGSGGFVELTAAGGQTSADAVRFVSVAPQQVNRPPLAAADATTTVEGAAVDVAVLANDSDPDGDPLAVASVGAAAHGATSVNPDETVRYAPGQGFAGTDSFSYTVADGRGGTATATVTVIVTAFNHPPIAADDSATTGPGVPVDIPVLANDTDPDGDALTVLAVTQGAKGTVAINADRTLRYTSASTATGSDSFTYTVSDGRGGRASATVSVALSATAGAEVILDDGGPGTSYAGSWLISSVAGAYKGRSLYTWGSANAWYRWRPNLSYGGTYEVYLWWTASAGRSQAVPVRVVHAAGEATTTVDQSKNGGAWVSLGRWTFGSGSAGFVEVSGAGGQASADAARFVLIGSTQTNHPPTAADVHGTTNEGTPVDLDVLTGASDPDGDFLRVESVTAPANGAASVNPDGTLHYVPVAGFHGTDAFSYTLSDSRGGTATATATVDVIGPNRDPVAVNDSATTLTGVPVDVAVLANDTDPDGDALTVTAVTQGARGAVSVNADRTVRYAPNPGVLGTDTFTYTAADGRGGTATAAVTVAVFASNRPPVAVDDSVSTFADVPMDVAVLANDADPDGDPLTVAAVTQGARGAVSVNADGTVRYAPDPGALGTDTFTYTAADGRGGTATATVTVQVLAPNHPPVAVNDSASTPTGEPVDVAVLANDSDPDGDPLTVAAVTQGTRGAVSINADGSVRYFPDPGALGTDTFTYTAADGRGGTATATVTVQVLAPNRPPVAADDSAATPAGVPVNIAVLANDTDPDGDPLTVTAVTQGARGAVSVNADRTVRYVPSPGALGSDTFTYTAADGRGGTAVGTVSVTVASVVPPGTERVVDDGEAGTSRAGSWFLSSAPGAYGLGSLYTWGGAGAWYRWAPALPGLANYDVYLWWTASPGRSRAVPVRVVHTAGEWDGTVDQTQNGGRWVLLGRWSFNGTGGSVQVSGASGQASADAVRFVSR